MHPVYTWFLGKLCPRGFALQAASRLIYPVLAGFTGVPNTQTDIRTNHGTCDMRSNRPHAGGSVAEWLACWTQAQKARVQIAVATLSGNSVRQTVHTHCASVHQAAKLVAALLRVAGVTAGLAGSNGSLPPGL